ncbi:hypothetical protein BP5796_07478 [Coleophoma crateriformis]|uniref:F-box domain-containing protein n=1 Tax=Coleophoma crateriformis TaxID=565419 RepID=A0A3D8RJ95_9HELO|nr:hypothetical protein BP5796_07478 [Coleophoma crateriformis]
MTTGFPGPDALSDTASQPDEQLTAIPKTSAATQAVNDSKHSGIGAGQTMAASEQGGTQHSEKVAMDAKTKISSLLKDKEKEWTAVAEKKGPLRLLDLPMDVLKEIVKEVTHTNDLTALALTHSALHNLAIPHIYSRFDIVWPDAHATSDPRTGVDALTYGLATLCMGNVLLAPAEEQTVTCSNCGTSNTIECNHGLESGARVGQRQLGNQYPQFTRKFSLGNGPADWVQEYLITKESGKMLGTLVALAVARMTNLETFVWDMPTGVLRDVWLALSSLQNRAAKQECRLERVWVRWHDNSDPSNMPPGQSSSPTSNPTSQILAGSTMTSVGWVLPAANGPNQGLHNQPSVTSYAQSRVEYPTFSVLPPLKSLSVLDVDEVDYLDEMSVLIANSKHRLRELRVGISAKAINRDFALAWDGPNLQQVDHKAQWPGASTIGNKRLGGVLGVLLGRVFDIRKKQAARPDRRDLRTSMASSTPIPPDSLISEMQQELTSTTGMADVASEGHSIMEGSIEQHSAPETPDHESVPDLSPSAIATSNGQSLLVSDESINTTSAMPGVDAGQSDIDSLTALISAHSIAPSVDAQEAGNQQAETPNTLPLRRSKCQSKRSSHFSENAMVARERLDGKLRLQTLELERVPLSVAVLHKAFDWSVLTCLTILDCPQYDRLWSMLRRHFQPTPVGVNIPPARHGSNATTVQYHLSLKKIHTDAACPALITFLKETLAPNTLEVLFLQDRKRSTASSITIDAIYRGPLKRHRGSLKKLMLDSSDRMPRGPTSASESTRWRAWMPTRDVLNFITSGRMSSLRELSIAIDYKDWHHFLQRLPQIPHLRSLNIPFIADHVTPAFDPRELALQVVDVIVLRPEIELCYMGVSHKCFEILENRPHDDVHGMGDTHSSGVNGATGAVTDDDDEDEDEDDGSDEEEEDDDDDGTAIAQPAIDPDETESEMSDHDDSDTDSYDGSEDGRSKLRLRLREILFYDDKVAIFKARHGKL